MQEYLEQSALSRVMDAAGLQLLMLLLCPLWFILLWGLSLPALAAGAALYLLWLILYKKRRDGQLRQKEKRLRLRIGGELALERMLTEAPHKTHFETALLLSLSGPMKMERIAEDGVLCRREGKRVLVAFCPLPISDELDARTVLRFQQAVRKEQAEGGILCLPCGVSPKAREQAESEPPVHILSRDRMIPLLGRQFPATDEQLIALGRRRKRKNALKKWLPRVLDRQRSGRYALYGGLLLLLYLITGLLYYALPGLMCIALSAACRCTRRKDEAL